MSEKKSSGIWIVVLYGAALLTVIYTVAGVGKTGGWVPVFLLAPMLILLLPPIRIKVDPRDRYLPSPKWSLFVVAVLMIIQASMFGDHAAKVEVEREAERLREIQAKHATLRVEREKEFVSSKAEILSSIDGLLAEGKARDALALANKYFAVTKDPDLFRRQFRADIAVMKLDLANENNLLLERRIQIYTALIDEEPGNAAQYREKLKTANEALTIKNKMHEVAAKREALERIVRGQLSPIDGSHPQMATLIKSFMNNPKSYEHVQTRFQAGTEMATIVTTFRGTNQFGAVVTNKAVATVDDKGTVTLESIN